MGIIGGREVPTSLIPVISGVYTEKQRTESVAASDRLAPTEGDAPTTLLMGETEDARKPIRVVQHVANGCGGIEVLVSSLIGCWGGSTLAVVGLVLLQ